MEVKINSIDKVKQEVEFEIPYSELTPHFEKALLKYKNKVNIPGFRKGKAPVSMIKKMYGDMIEQGSLEDVANDVFKEYLKNNEVPILGEGALVDMDYQPKELFKFKITYEIKPEFEVTNYKGIDVNKTIYPVNDHSIDDEIKYLRSKHVTYEEAQIAEDNEHVLTLDIQKLDDAGMPVIGQHDKDIKFYLNDEQLSPDLKKQLEGMAVGDERLLTVTANEQQEKPDKYQAIAMKVEKVIYPELTAEFFKKVYKDEIKDEAEFRNKIKEDLEKIYSNMTEQELKNNVISELVKLNDVPVPDVLVENVLNNNIEDMKTQHPKRELPADFNEAEYRKTRRADAIMQVKWYLIRDKIMEAEKIEVTDEDIEPLITEDAVKYNIPADKLRNIYKENPEVKYRLLDKKLMDFLIQNANIKDVVHTHEHKIET
ncbi:MAG: trigger factor [Ignavibacteriae bacterium]|nr:MAG: trigger factor [Ignavibacteriota bacterium]